VVFIIYNCLLQSNVENMSPQIIRQVTKELIDLQKNPPEGIKVFMNEEDVTDIQATIEGPGNCGRLLCADSCSVLNLLLKMIRLLCYGKPHYVTP